MNFNIYNSLILAGVVQGFIFGMVIPFSNRYKAKSTLFLVAIIVSYSIGNLQYLLPDVGLMDLKTMYSYVYLPVASIMSPLLYFHVTTLLEPDKENTRLEKALYVPFVFFLLLVLICRVLIIFNPSKELLYQNLKTIIDIHEVFSIALTVAILTIVLKKLYSFEKLNQTFKIEFIKPQLNWLKLTVMFILLLTILWAYLTFINLVYPERYISYYSLWLGLAASIYWLGHIGIYKFGINEDRKKLRKYALQQTTPKMAVETKNEHIKAFEHELINQKKYLDSTLSLDKVAERLEISSSYLSRIIKVELGTSFSDYINAFRVEAAKSYLENPEFSNYTIVSIGLEAGFNSKSAFFDVFKKTTGKTPSVYKKENQKHLKKKAS